MSLYTGLKLPGIRCSCKKYIKLRNKSFEYINIDTQKCTGLSSCIDLFLNFISCATGSSFSSIRVVSHSYNGLETSFQNCFVSDTYLILVWRSTSSPVFTNPEFPYSFAVVAFIGLFMYY